MLDYHYQLGRLKALLHVSQKYKEESEKATEELKLKVKAVRDVMEGVDLRLIECFHNVVIGKRTQTTYFEALGQQAFSRSASHGVDVKFLPEHLVSQLIQVDYWATHMGYIDHQKKKKIDEDTYL